VHDICGALLASMDAPAPGAVYNVADDDPAPRSEVVAFAQQQLQQLRAAGGGAAPAARAAPDAAAAAAAAAAPAAAAAAPPQGGGGGGGRGGRAAAALEEKRVRNARIKEQLGVRLAYPSYREGVQAILGGCAAPFDADDLVFLGLAG
jgi:hypothetical protein